MPSPSTADIRAWAQDQGHPVAARGRLPTDILGAYDKAQARSRPASPGGSWARQPAAVTDPPAPDGLAAHLAAVESRLAALTRRVEALEGARPRRRLVRRRT